VLLKYIFFNLNFEDDRSASADVTGYVKHNIIKAVATSRTFEVSNDYCIKNSKYYFIDFNFSNSSVIETNINHCRGSSSNESLLYLN